ncbi:hypothetical protein JHK85_000929 [Glycine max]|nr:hypothetical protein JHK85_000929 [Glycine max]
MTCPDLDKKRNSKGHLASSRWVVGFVAAFWVVGSVAALLNIEGHAYPRWNKYIVSALKLNALFTIGYIGVIVYYGRNVFIFACHGH